MDERIDRRSGRGDGEEAEESDGAGYQLPRAAVLARIVADDCVLVFPADRGRKRRRTVHKGRIPAMPILRAHSREVDPQGLGLEHSG